MPIERITHPQVSIVPMNLGAAIDVSLNGKIPQWFPLCQPFIWGGDAAFVAKNVPYFAILRVKTDGSFCWYSDAPSPAYVPVDLSNDLKSVYFLNPSLIQLNGYSNVKMVQLPQYFQNSGFVNLRSTTLAIPPCPCNPGVPVAGTYFDAGNKRMLVEYVQDFAEAYNLWASVYQTDGTSLKLLNGGYVGNFPNGTDPITDSSQLANFRSIKYGFTNGKFTYQQNGLLIGRGVDFWDLVGNFAAVCSTQILPGNLNCAGTGAPFPSYSATLSTVLDASAKEFAGTKFQTNYQSNQAGATDLQNVAAIANTYDALDLFDSSGARFVELFPVCNDYMANAVYVGGKSISFTTAWIGSHQPYNVNVYIGTPKTNVPIIAPPPQVNTLRHGLMNFHRPVSVIGAYKA